jgi:mevalonate kinase
MHQQWYSNGKLMLTGEYLVLLGAKALAVPVNRGQWLEVTEEKGKPLLTFTTNVLDKPWFEAQFNIDTFEILNANNASSACYLQELLVGIRVLDPFFLRNKKKVDVSTKINFDLKWGLGSSSTLISNMAWWANVDPFELNHIVSIGSGYDIACARSTTPILYWVLDNLPNSKPTILNTDCYKNVWFIYLGNKVDTEDNLSKTMHTINPGFSEIKDISELTIEFAEARKVTDLLPLIKSHESIISGILKRPTLQSSKFSDFKGAIKSLGAWGGDFCMAASEENEGYIKNYFEQKGYKSVLSFKELAL